MVKDKVEPEGFYKPCQEVPSLSAMGNGLGLRQGAEEERIQHQWESDKEFTSGQTEF